LTSANVIHLSQNYIVYGIKSEVQDLTVAERTKIIWNWPERHRSTQAQVHLSATSVF